VWGGPFIATNVIILEKEKAGKEYRVALQTKLEEKSGDNRTRDIEYIFNIIKSDGKWTVRTFQKHRTIKTY